MSKRYRYSTYIKRTGCGCKLKPHYSLETVKKLVSENRFLVSKTVRIQAFDELGATEATIADVVMNLTQRDFHKSTPDWNVKRRWQDAYFTSYDRKEIYVKFTVADNEDVCILIVTSFKESIDAYQ